MLSAKIEARDFRGTSPTATRSGDRITLGAIDAENRLLTLYVTASAPGTISMSDGNFNNYVLYSEGTTPNQSVWSTSAGGSGSVTFTTLSATGASGTFAFTAGALSNSPATGTRTISAGTFTVKF